MTFSNPHIVVMGVSACGKSSVADGMARQLHLPFIEGDAFHPAENIRKMNHGIALDDNDRWSWLRSIALDMNRHDHPVVATCSALRRSYRDALREGSDRPLFFVHLVAPQEVLTARMAGRTRHFMPVSLLESQFATLENLQQDEDGVRIDVTPPLDIVVANAVAAVRAHMT